MNTQQQIILWIGLILTTIYLFTDKTFHTVLTSKSSGSGTVTDANFTSSAVGTTSAQATSVNPGAVVQAL
jgi:hypothetical protein